MTGPSFPLSPPFRLETRANLRLAVPLVLAQLSFVGMGAVDTIIAGRLGGPQLAAVAVGANLWFMLFVPFMGLFMAVSPIVAQRHGAGRPGVETGGFLRGAVALAFLVGIVWLLSLRLGAGPVLDLLQLEPVTRGYCDGYVHAVAWSAIPLSLFFALRNGAEGYGQTRTTLWAGLSGFTVNALLAYGLANGRWGLPALGPTGCGIATVIGGATMVAAFLLMYRWHPRLRELALLRPGWPRLEAQTGEIFRIGAPIALIVTAEAWLFLIGALLMARFGTTVVAAHQIAINFASLTFMVPMSIGMATSVRVGHAVGAGAAPAVLRLRGYAGIALGALFALLSASLMALAPHPIVGAYTQVADVAALAVRFLYYAAVFQIADCVQATANGALRGLKDTRVPMLITVSAYWLIGFPIAIGLAFDAGIGPAGIWGGFIGGLAAAAAGLSLRFRHETRSLHST